LTQELLDTQAALHETVTVEVIGHSGPTEDQNLSQRRADRIVEHLVQFGIPKAILLARGDPVRPEDTEWQYNRSATFRVIVTPSGHP
jgi:outer membrane protein OmpA-like peptidoglycan-associated protein